MTSSLTSFAGSRVLYPRLVSPSSTFIAEKKCSLSALSQQFPLRDMLRTTWSPSQSFTQPLDQYTEPWSLWIKASLRAFGGSAASMPLTKSSELTVLTEYEAISWLKRSNSGLR